MTKLAKKLAIVTAAYVVGVALLIVALVLGSTGLMVAGVLTVGVSVLLSEIPLKNWTRL